MSDLPLTHHAAARLQQRSIPPIVVEWLIEYGATERSGGGTQLHYFTKDTRRRLAKRVGDQVVTRLAALLDAYVVVSSDGVVVTAGHRFRRIQRDR
jgi:hypothetical protein